MACKTRGFKIFLNFLRWVPGILIKIRMYTIVMAKSTLYCILGLPYESIISFSITLMEFCIGLMVTPKIISLWRQEVYECRRWTFFPDFRVPFPFPVILFKILRNTIVMA